MMRRLLTSLCRPYRPTHVFLTGLLALGVATVFIERALVGETAVALGTFWQLPVVLALALTGLRYPNEVGALILGQLLVPLLAVDSPLDRLHELLWQLGVHDWEVRTAMYMSSEIAWLVVTMLYGLIAAFAIARAARNSTRARRVTQGAMLLASALAVGPVGYLAYVADPGNAPSREQVRALEASPYGNAYVPPVPVLRAERFSEISTDARVPVGNVPALGWVVTTDLTAKHTWNSARAAVPASYQLGEPHQPSRDDSWYWSTLCGPGVSGFIQVRGETQSIITIELHPAYWERRSPWWRWLPNWYAPDPCSDAYPAYVGDGFILFGPGERWR